MLENWLFIYRRKIYTPPLTNQGKMDQIVKHKTKILETPRGKCRGSASGHRSMQRIFAMTRKAQATKAKIDKWYFIKLKSSGQQRRQTTE
jgi:hypothetical protein